MTAVVVGLLTAVGVSHSHAPILGLFIGALVGTVAGGVVYAFVFCWPVLRVFWHWAPEITLATGLVYGWTVLMDSTSLLASALVVTAVFGVPALVGPVRRWIVALAWCQIVRHRLRLCFVAFLHSGGMYHASHPPLILWARPTPAGERVWIWLRPGLALSDLEGRTDKIAVACWATEARVVRAAGSKAALIRVDITRRDPLKVTVKSPLATMVPNTEPANAPTSPGMPPVFDLDLADITDVTPEADNTSRRPRNSKPTAPSGPAPIDEYDAFI